MALNRFLFHRAFFKLKNAVKSKQNATFAMGVSSLVDKGNDLHFPMLDYDTKDLQNILEDLHKLTFKHELKTCYLYGTRKGFHAIFPFDIRHWNEVQNIIWDAGVDWRYKSFAQQYKRVFLRVAGKYKDQDIKFVGVSKSPFRPTHEECLIGNSIIEMHESLFNMHDKLFPRSKLYD